MKRFFCLALFFFLFVFISQANAQQEGQLIKGSSAAVYYLVGNKRYVFPNSRIYFSWFSSFSSVQTISDQQLQQYPLGGNIHYRPGTRLVKITSDPRVYAVGFDGALYPIASEQAAIALYGPDWSKRVDDLSDAFFSGYEIKPSLDGTSYPPGTVIRNAGTKQMYLLLEENGQTVYRTVSRSLEDDLAISPAYIHEVNSLPYQPSQSTQDLLSFTRPVRLTTAQPGTDPADEPVINPPSQPLPEKATLSVSRRGASGLRKIIKTAPQAVAFEFTLKGDAAHTMNISEIPLRFYVDANDQDSDFQPGIDTDGNTTRSIDQLIRNIRLVNTRTGEQIAQIQQASNTTLKIPVNISLSPQSEVPIQVIVSTVSVPTPVPRFSVDVLTSEIVLSVPSAQTVSISGESPLNGGVSPKVYATFTDRGTFSIDDANRLANGVHFFGETITPFTLKLTATDEGVEVRTLSIELADGTDDPLLVEDLDLVYEQDGQTIRAEYDRFENNSLYVFTNLGLFIEAGQIIDVAIEARFAPYTRTLSDKRVQFAFARDYFFATAEHSRFFFSSTSFGSAATDRTAAGPVHRLRNSLPVFDRGTETPSGSKNRFSSTHLLTFSAQAIHNPVWIHKLSFRVDTNNAGTAGPDNDLLENLAKLQPFQASKLYLQNENADGGRVQRTAESVTFGVFRPSVGLITDLSGYESKVGDYGIFVYNFGTAPFQLSTVQKSVFEFEMDTSLIPGDVAANVRVTVMGASDFSWDDGSRILANGSIVPTLPYAGANISFSRLFLP